METNDSNKKDFNRQILGKAVAVEYDCSHCDYLTPNGKCKMFQKDKDKIAYLQSLKDNQSCEYFCWQSSLTMF